MSKQALERDVVARVCSHIELVGASPVSFEEDPPDVLLPETPMGRIAVEVTRLNFCPHETLRENELLRIVELARQLYDEEFGRADDVWVGVHFRADFRPRKRDRRNLARKVAAAVNEAVGSATEAGSRDLHFRPPLTRSGADTFPGLAVITGRIGKNFRIWQWAEGVQVHTNLVAHIEKAIAAKDASALPAKAKANASQIWLAIHAPWDGAGSTGELSTEDERREYGTHFERLFFVTPLDVRELKPVCPDRTV